MPGDNSLVKLISDSVTLMASVIGNSFQHSKSASWDRQTILNRSSGVVNYSHSENETVSFTVKFAALSDAVSEVVLPINALRSLVFPKSPGVVPPSVCYLTYSWIFNDWMCVVTDISVSYPDDIWDESGNPMTAVVSIKLLEVDIQNTAAGQIGGGTAYSPMR